MDKSAREFSATVFFTLAFACNQAIAADQRMGNWIVSSTKDPFSTKHKTVAFVPSGDEAALAIRCFPDDGLSVIVVIQEEKHFEPGSTVNFKYRADEGEIIEDKGQAFGEKAIEMPIARKILADAEKTNTLYIRMQTPSDATLDMAFKTKGAAKALAAIKTDCPESEPEEKRQN